MITTEELEQILKTSLEKKYKQYKFNDGRVRDVVKFEVNISEDLITDENGGTYYNNIRVSVTGKNKISTKTERIL